MRHKQNIGEGIENKMGNYTFFYKQHFYNQQQAEIGQKPSKC